MGIKLSLMLSTKKILLIVITILFLFTNIFSQEKSVELKEKAKIIFQSISEGISSNNIEKFSEYFGNKIYLSLSREKAGYFSNNQSFYILKTFFDTHRPFSCTFFNLNINARNPFAIGEVKYLYKGKRKKSQIFISLDIKNQKITISQITVN